MASDVDIIIVNYNSTDYLLSCIDSIYRSLNGKNADIFVEDNASKDGVNRINQCFPEVQVNRNRSNIGFGAAVNQALIRGNSPYIVLINPDSKVESGLFDQAITYLIDNPDVGVLGPRVFDSNGDIQGSARSFPTPLTALFGRQSLFTRMFPDNRITRANLLANQCDGRTPMEVDWISGACMLLRRDAVNQVGVLDERFFMYWEDADWCRRMKENNWKVIYFPIAKVLHYVGKSSSKLLIRSTYEFHKSVYLLYNKYYRGTLQFLKPLIILGLFYRFCFVTFSSKLNYLLTNHKERAGHFIKKTPVSCTIDRPISVLRMIARLNIGGPSIHVHLLTQKLNPVKFKSTLVTGRISPLEGDMNYLFGLDESKPIRIPELQREISLIMDLQAFLRIFSILKQKAPDIVHTHTAKAGFSARFAVIVYNLLFRRDVKIVHTFHGNVFEGYFNPLSSYLFVLIERIIARFTDIIVAISESQKLELRDKYKVAPDYKLRTIRLGFNLHPFVESTNLRGRFKERIGVDADTRLIGIIGRLVPIKNHHMFLDSVRLFLIRNHDQKVKFVIIGDGELRKVLENYAKRKGIEKHIIFCGWIRQIPLVYADLDILALTSKNEGTPVSIIEAMASGVPVLATDAGGVRDLLGSVNRMGPENAFQYCERGIICHKNDAVGFGRGMEALINTPVEKINKQMAKAREFVMKTYSQDRLISDIERLYQDLTAQEPTRDISFTPITRRDKFDPARS